MNESILGQHFQKGLSKGLCIELFPTIDRNEIICFDDNLFIELENEV